uniref:Replication termination factor 2 n=1 Tax=Chromera velia CCMP2878 TaxID=1169474 RepID=A0A0G4GW74_9ALVE|eukprot:Cvel_23663.t1-p1 / transcript=Cvel_23663.t1 / gene=Cvel_23663 / organism=Chromera_velia_CCMP2878 / gene_product=Replication termination factor 2, putative / transcript_product=Replication termination factor 2, putative / location=Cvel_scaffold2464:12527-13432(-) / protein_length=302 / sequence_SO=supercontig / SO=protein_coding / is_pseudo=false
MGGDGGSIPLRADVVRTKGFKFSRNLGGMGYAPNTQVFAEERMDPNKIREIRWTSCALSQEPLEPPIVACKLGNLYNKKTVLETILEKKLPEFASHIKSFKKDLKEIPPSFFSTETKRLFCPLGHVDLTGAQQATLNWRCGCVVSKKAQKELGGGGRDGPAQPLCVSCSQPYDPSTDLIDLVPTDEQFERLRGRIAKEEETARQKKRAAASKGGSAEVKEGSCSSASSSSSGLPSKRVKEAEKEEDVLQKKMKQEKTETQTANGKEKESREDREREKDKDRHKQSAVYKSLFNSSNPLKRAL